MVETRSNEVEDLDSEDHATRLISRKVVRNDYMNQWHAERKKQYKESMDVAFHVQNTELDLNDPDVQAQLDLAKRQRARGLRGMEYSASRYHEQKSSTLVK